MSEKEHAVVLASKVLDNPRRDPDDDLAVLARQFLRAREAMTVIRDIAEGSRTANSLPHIGRIAREALSTPDIPK